MPTLGTITYYTSDNQKRTFDLDNALQTMGSSMESGAGTSWYSPTYYLPPDSGSEPRANYSFPGGTFSDKISAEDQAKMKAYVAMAKPLQTKATEIYNTVRSGATGGKTVQQSLEIRRQMNEFKSQDFPELQKGIMEEQKPLIDQAAGRPVEAAPTYGENPRTGTPMGFSEAYSFARQAEPGLSIPDFRDRFQVKQEATTASEAGTFGTNPRTGQPFNSFSEAYSFAKQADPSLTVDKFRDQGAQPTLPDGSAPTQETAPSVDQSTIDGINKEAGGMFEGAVGDISDVIRDMLPENVDPMDLTEAELDDIMREAEATVGPQFTRLRERAEQDFSLGQRFAQENLQKVFKETGIDVKEQKVRMSRNYQEAVQDSQAAMANRQLSFGGSRIKEEDRLATAQKERVGDLEKQAGRGLTGAQQGFERQFGTDALPELDKPGFELEPFKTQTGTEPGTSQIQQTRGLEDNTRQTAEQTEIEFQRRKANRELPEG